MNNWHYHNPVRVSFGVGCLNELPNVLAGRGALLVTFPEASEAGLLLRLEDLIGKWLLGVVQVPSEPDVTDLKPLYDRIRNDFPGTKVIVAVGGGSVIDTGKILSVVSRDGTFESLRAEIAGDAAGICSVVPLIAVPTTAGTGSEVTPWATFWDRTVGTKLSLQRNDIFPKSALVDPELTLTVPPSPTLASGLDALSHALESVWNVNANPVSDSMAIRAAREILAVLPDLMRNPARLELRTRMAKAALLAGLAFSNTQTALAHSISYPMTLRYGLPHGIACSFCLPFVLRKARGLRQDRDDVLRQIFGENLEHASADLEAFLGELGVNIDFASYGVGPEETERIVVEAEEGARGHNFIGRTTPM